ncbi:MAG: biopolymer transporter ExbD [Leptolyngbyaceae bacterium]|nr:biopolymer transporter ExbD [Leptolyngbyaceae bacterium]
MKTNWESTSDDVRIEILPLIDVIFCILTFFILASVVLTRQSGINVDLPAAETGTTQMREMIIVSVDPVGQLYLEQQPISPDQLIEALRTYRQNRPDGLMVLYASRSALYDDVVNVLDLLRSVGGDRVALATLPESGTAEDEFPGFEEFNFEDPLSPEALPGESDLNDPNSFEFELDGTDPNEFGTEQSPSLNPLNLDNENGGEPSADE